jgi:membrane protease YdiL (CAAX protease family)
MTLFFLLLVVVAMPWLSYVSFKNINALEAADATMRISRRSVYLQSIVMQTGLCIAAFYTARMEGLQINLHPNFQWTSILSGAGFLILALSFAGLSQKNKSNKESTLRHILPENNADRIFWIIAVLFAAFCEEYIYRGVLYQVLLQQTEHSTYLAAIISAVVFSFGHGTQGEKAIIQIIPFALGFHLLVYLSGGLILPMIVHFIYNISVELFFGEKIRNGHNDR